MNEKITNTDATAHAPASAPITLQELEAILAAQPVDTEVAHFTDADEIKEDEATVH